MAQLRDTVVSGSLRATDSLLSTTAQFKILMVPDGKTSTTYGKGTDGQFLRSSSSQAYWCSLAIGDIPGINTSSGSTAKCLTEKGTFASFTNNAGTVTSVQVQASAPLSSSSSSASSTTLSTTISFSNQSHNKVLAGPSGTSAADAAPTFRALVAADLPTATTSAKGIMQVGTGLGVSSGTVSVTYGTAAGAALASSGSAGSANSASRSDHTHPFPALSSCTGTISITDKTTGTLTIARGGTGKTTALEAITNLCGPYIECTGTAFTDGKNLNTDYKVVGTYYAATSARTAAILGVKPSSGSGIKVFTVGGYRTNTIYQFAGNSSASLYYRSAQDATGTTPTWTDWHQFVLLQADGAQAVTDNQGTVAKFVARGGATTPVYVNSSGVVKACTSATGNTASSLVVRDASGNFSAGTIISQAEVSFVSSTQAKPWPYIRFDTRAGTSAIGTGTTTYTTADITSNGMIYFQTMCNKNTYATAGDTSSAVTVTRQSPRFFFREQSRKANDTISKVSSNYYEDYYLPTVNENRTSNAFFDILTSKYTVTIAQGGTGITSTDPHKVLIGPASGSTAAAPTWRKPLVADLDVHTGSQTAQVTSSPYQSALWKFNLSRNATSFTTGDTILIKTPGGGGSQGVFLSLDNGTTYRPVCVSGTTRLTTHFSSGVTLMLTYDSAGQANGIYGTVNASGTLSTTTGSNNVSGGCWRVLNLYDSGNSNDTGTLVRDYGGNVAIVNTTTVLYPYELLFSVIDTNYGWKAIPANTTSKSTATNKSTIFQTEFNPFGDIFYYSTDAEVAANANVRADRIWRTYPVDIRYSFNCGSTLTAAKDVYIVAYLTDNCKAKLRNPTATGDNAKATATGANAGPITQTLPTTNDGYIYIKLGRAYGTYQVDLCYTHPIYWHDGYRLQVLNSSIVRQDISGINLYYLTSNLHLTHGASLVIHHASSSLDFLVHMDTDGRHGLYSKGYYNGSNYVADEKWMIYRDISNYTIIPEGQLTIKYITSESQIPDNFCVLKGSGASWTGSLTSMAYAGILVVGNNYDRGWQMWAQRGDGQHLYWRNPNDAANAWNTPLQILDSKNGAYKSHFHDNNQRSSGYILIKIKPQTSWMLNFTVNLYQAYRSYHIQISGYNYGTNHWYNPTAVLLGSNITTAIRVYFGYTSDWNLWVGIPAANYPAVSISDVNNGYEQAEISEMFEISYVSSISGTTQTYVDIQRPILRGEVIDQTVAIVNNTQNNATYNSLLYVEHKSGNDWGIYINKGGSYDYGLTINCLSTGSNGINCTGRITGTKVYGAVWNDYAEYRQGDITEGGYCVRECLDGKMRKSDERLQAGCRITSDTFGFAIGETEKCKTPIAVSGRVLVYPYRNRDEYPLGAAVCSAPGGTVDIMTREEIIQYPERIIGTVSEIPNYEVWECGEGKDDKPNHKPVNGRIWIYVK